MECVKITIFKESSEKNFGFNGSLHITKAEEKQVSAFKCERKTVFITRQALGPNMGKWGIFNWAVSVFREGS